MKRLLLISAIAALGIEGTSYAYQSAPDDAPIKQNQIDAQQSEREVAMADFLNRILTWSYDEKTDEMSGASSRFAHISSQNTFSFGFPYQGNTRAILSLRNHPRSGHDVMFSITRGQILCRPRSCPITIKFDDGKPITVFASESSSGRGNTVFLPNYRLMMQQLPITSTVRIEFEVFRQGTHIATFDVRGFDASKLNDAD